MDRLFRKADIVLFVVLIAISITLSVMSATWGKAGREAYVSVDGKVYGTYDLNKNQTVKIENGGHRNQITIEDGTVRMSCSDCKNQNCVKQGRISDTNQSIVCLPNRVMVEIRGEEDSKYDALAE